MFSKAKLKRFNEELSCAPPPTKYDPRVPENCSGMSLDRAKRWNERKEILESGTFVACSSARDLTSSTPFKKGRVRSNSQLNSSVASSASSNSGFQSPPQTFSRSRSFKSMVKDVRSLELKEQIKQLSKEKRDLQDSLANIQKELSELKIAQESFKSSNTVPNVADRGIQVSLDIVCQQEDSLDEPQDLSCKKTAPVTTIPTEELEILRDKIDHLTILRDNLEACVAGKETTITELQDQMDVIVSDAQKGNIELEACKQEMENVQKKLEETQVEVEKKCFDVRELVAKYEALTKQHEDACMSTKEIIAQKDIEIELLNDSISTINTQVAVYEKTISRIQSDITLQQSHISSLEMTVGDLSIATIEKRFVETILNDEIQEKHKEMSILECNLKDVELRLKEIKDDRESLFQKLREENASVTVLQKKVDTLEMELKERGVVQQFLEKEVASREGEVNELSVKLADQERELETARKVALDLQHEAETQLNKVFCLEASLSAKDYDLDQKEDLINKLMEEKVSTTLELTEQLNLTQKTHTEVIEETRRKEERIIALEENISNLKSALDKEEDHSNNLEERVVQLMIENGEAEEQFKRRLLDKESEIEELSVKYSDALLEQESTKRLLSITSEKLERENLLLQATEKELEKTRLELMRQQSSYSELESSTKILTHKLVHIEDALTCEEAESRELQRKLENTQELASDLKREKEALRSANEGYAGQISMLKIDMTKKSLAVEDMQVRIEELREEKNTLLEERKCLHEERTLLEVTLKLLESKLGEKETMLQDLQEEFESSLLTITKLQEELNNTTYGIEELKKLLAEKNRDEVQRVMAFEEEKSDFFNQISVLENHLREEQEQKAAHKTKVLEMEDKVTAVEEKKERVMMEMHILLKKEASKVETLEEKLFNLNRRYEGYEDQLNNMQTSLLDKTAEAEKWNRGYVDLNQTSVSYKEKIEDLKKDISRLVKESELLSNSLTSKDTFLSSLNDSIFVKSEEIQGLHKNLDEKQKQLSALEQRLQEMEKTVTHLKEERDKATSQALTLQESLDVTKEELLRVNCTLEREHENRLAELSREHSHNIDELTREKATLQQESDMWRRKFEYLENMIEPFREQLDAYEVEKFALLSKTDAAQSQMKKLSEEYARLVGHNNHKQKIQHVVKLKSENNQLRERVLKLQAELEKQKKVIRRLEEKGDPHPPLGMTNKSKSAVFSGAPKPVLGEVEDKENASPERDPQRHVTSTPLTTSKNNRYRRL